MANKKELSADEILAKVLGYSNPEIRHESEYSKAPYEVTIDRKGRGKMLVKIIDKRNRKHMLTFEVDFLKSMLMKLFLLRKTVKKAYKIYENLYQEHEREEALNRVFVKGGK